MDFETWMKLSHRLFFVFVPLIVFWLYSEDIFSSGLLGIVIGGVLCIASLIGLIRIKNLR